MIMEEQTNKLDSLSHSAPLKDKQVFVAYIKDRSGFITDDKMSEATMNYLYSRECHKRK